jgi:hypothetical protein
MKHSVREFYRIDGQKLYTEDYIIANNIPMCEKGDYRHGWSVALYFSPNRDTVNVYTATGKVVMYAFGEKTLFDTREERDAYRIQYTKDREAMVSKNKVIKAITAKLNEMDEESLRKLLATLEAC